uniref:Nuclear receptor domain-containing protein n=1 Tax=Panagrolaimus sp. PS1159 TaxID=55785 RepID=A0AC35GV91_9BILA
MKCTICENSSDGYHFNVVSCRACSSFFRRTLAENKTYVCRKENKCNVSFNYRNICRACRMRRCFEVGMKKADAISDTQILTPPIPALQVQAATSITMDTSMHLKNVYLFWHGYLSSLKSLYTVENPKTIFTETEYKLIKQSHYDKVERASMSMLFSLLIEHITPFKRLNHDQRVIIMKNVARSIAMIYKTSLTAVVFPNDADKFVTSFGYYIDRKNVGYFFEYRDGYNEIEKLLYPVVNEIISVAKGFLGYREVEVGLLAVMLLAQRMRKEELSDAENEIYWRELLAEAHADIVNTYGFANGGIKFAELFMKLSRINDIMNLMNESVTLMKIFMPTSVMEIWDHYNC